MENFFESQLKISQDYGIFLESMFEYLKKRTDFFERPAEAERLILSTFEKFKESKVPPIRSQAAELPSSSPAALSKPVAASASRASSDLLALRYTVPIPIITENGFDYGQFRWTQSLGSIDITVPLMRPIDNIKKLAVEFSPNHVLASCQVHGDSGGGRFLLLPRSPLSHTILAKECIWTLVSKKTLEISLIKARQNEWWRKLFQDDPVEIHSHDITPETVSTLSDLDSETRATVEKMMREQRAKQLMNHS